MWPISFWNGFWVLCQLSCPSNHKTHARWLSGGSQSWCCPFVMKHHQHSTKAWETSVHEPPEERQRDKGVKSVALLRSQNTPFHSSNTVLAVSSLTHNHPFPSFSVIPFGGKANTSVMSVLFWEAPDDKCLDGIDEPQWATSQPQHPPCVPSCFSFLVLFIHIHHRNAVHVIVSPMVCSSIQPMSCAIHFSISLQLNHTITLAFPSQKTHTMWEVSSQQMPNTQTRPWWRPFNRCMHHKDKAEVHSVLSVAGLHGDFMKGNGALAQCLKWFVEEGNSVRMGWTTRDGFRHGQTSHQWQVSGGDGTWNGHRRCILMQTQWVWVVCCCNTNHKPSHTSFITWPWYFPYHSTSTPLEWWSAWPLCWHHTSCVSLWMALTLPSSVTIMHCTLSSPTAHHHHWCSVGGGKQVDVVVMWQLSQYHFWPI